MHKVILFAVSLALAGCSVTDVKHVSYQQTQPDGSQPLPPSLKTIAVGNFTDQRSAAISRPNLLCEVSNAYNVVLKYVEADAPISSIVRNSFVQALTERGAKVAAEAPYEVNGTIDGLGCVYKVNKVFAAIITVNVVTLPERKVVFQEKYTTQNVENGVGAGILADVDSLVQSEERTLDQTVDKVLADPNFLSAASGEVAPPTSPQEAPATSIADRLKKLEELHAKGLISDKEYAAKRKAILDSL